MNRGVIMFAHNNGTTDYYGMAVETAKRVNRFLDLPVSIITDKHSVSRKKYKFDSKIYLEPETSNMRKNRSWYNKGRYRVYDLSPYDETLVLDTDYMVNSQQLLRVFDQPSDFVCHGHCYWPCKNHDQELLNPNRILGVASVWATVMRFRKGELSRDIFGMIEMIQNNYLHYSQIYGFLPSQYRNDYALAIALKTVHGHWPSPEYFLPWPLVHIDLGVRASRVSDTAYGLNYIEPVTNKALTIEIRDLDFHMLDKDNFLEIVK